MASNDNQGLILAPIRFPEKWISDRLMEQLSVIFKQHVSCKPEKLDLEDFYDPVRDQYHSTDILKHYILNQPVSGPRICYLVQVDLFIPILTFVFGEAHMNGRHCIVSARRLQEDFYMREGNEVLFEARLLKEIVHEVGHTFGLIHCYDDLCVMNNSYDISGTDRKQPFPCEMCFEKLDELLTD